MLFKKVSAMNRQYNEVFIYHITFTVVPAKRNGPKKPKF